MNTTPNNSVDVSMNQENSEYSSEDWSAIVTALYDLYGEQETVSDINNNVFTPTQLLNGDDIRIRNTDSEDSDDESDSESNSRAHVDIFTSNIQTTSISDDDDSDSNSMANFDTTRAINDNDDRAPYPNRNRNTRQPESRKWPQETSERKLIGIRSFATIYIEKAKLADRRGRNKLAIKYYAAAYELDPYMEYLSDYATCLEKDQQYKKAEVYYLEAIDNLDPKSKSNLAIYNLADMYLHLSRLKIKTSSGRTLFQRNTEHSQNTVQIIQTLPLRSESQESSTEFSNQKKNEESSTNTLFNNNIVQSDDEVTWCIDRSPSTISTNEQSNEDNKKESEEETDTLLL